LWCVHWISFGCTIYIAHLGNVLIFISCSHGQGKGVVCYLKEELVSDCILIL
jgi:hypothetical protein